MELNKIFMVFLFLVVVIVIALGIAYNFGAFGKVGGFKASDSINQTTEDNSELNSDTACIEVENEDEDIANIIKTSGEIYIHKNYKRPKNVPKNTQLIRYTFEPLAKKAKVTLFSRMKEFDLILYTAENRLIAKIKQDGCNLLLHSPALHEKGYYQTISDVFENITQNAVIVFDIDNNNNISINYVKIISHIDRPVKTFVLKTTQIKEIHVSALEYEQSEEEAE